MTIEYRTATEEQKAVIEELPRLFRLRSRRLLPDWI